MKKHKVPYDMASNDINIKSGIKGIQSSMKNEVLNKLLGIKHK